MFTTPKRHIACFGVFCDKIRPGALAVASCKTPPPKKTNTFWCAIWCAKSRMCGNETPGRIVTNFCTGVGVHDISTSAKFYDSRIWGFIVVEGQILDFSIDLHRRNYNTLALPCECIMWRVNDPLCPLCKEEEETSLHFLGKCCATANIYRLHFGAPFLEPGDLKQAQWITLLRFAKITKRFQ